MDRGYTKDREANLRESEEKRRLEWELEEGLLETFPASDAVTVTQPIRNRPAPTKRKEW